jgi:L-Ala-D/L-Glu epimerase
METKVAALGDDISMTIDVETLLLKTPLRISGYVFTTFPIILVTLRSGNHIGRGEASGVYYRGETPDGMIKQIEAVRHEIEAGIDRRLLRTLLSCGGARSAVDSALWDLEAQRRGCAVAELAGLERPRPLRTTFTLGADDPAVVAAAARAYEQALSLKLKLAGDNLDADRVRAARNARPDVWLGVDANQGFSLDSMAALMPTLLEARVRLIEQPFPIGRESDLDNLNSPILIAADESVQGLDDLESLVGRFDVVNIKLDKCGGLTEGLMMVQRAEALGLKPMVGCMGGTSLAMAPAHILGQVCAYVDLDGPVWLAQDRSPGALYAGGHIDCPAALWGSARYVGDRADRPNVAALR